VLERAGEEQKDLPSLLSLQKICPGEAKRAGNFMEVFGKYSSVDEMLKELRKLSARK